MDADGTKSPVLSAGQLADAWVYGDVVHHDPETIEAVRMFDINERYRSAAQLVALGMLLTIATLNLIRQLRDAGLLVALAQEAFDVDVVASAANDRRETRMWLADVGTPPPADIDEPFGEGWSQIQPWTNDR